MAGAVGSATLASHFGGASKIMAPTSCFNGQVHRLPDAPEAYGAMITPPKQLPAKVAPPTLGLRVVPSRRHRLPQCGPDRVS